MAAARLPRDATAQATTVFSASPAWPATAAGPRPPACSAPPRARPIGLRPRRSRSRSRLPAPPRPLSGLRKRWTAGGGDVAAAGGCIRLRFLEPPASGRASGSTRPWGRKNSAPGRERRKEEDGNVSKTNSTPRPDLRRARSGKRRKKPRGLQRRSWGTNKAGCKRNTRLRKN